MRTFFNGTYHLDCEAHEAGRMICDECGSVGPNEQLFSYSTVSGRYVREHEGLFCSRACHDRWYGLRGDRT